MGSGAQIGPQHAWEFERNLRIYVCRGGKQSLCELWPKVKLFI